MGSLFGNKKTENTEKNSNLSVFLSYCAQQFCKG